MRASQAAGILLVDDDELFARSQERHLARARPVFVAYSVEEAKKYLKEPVRRWCGFIFDVVLGDGTGLELLEIVRRDHPGVPTLIMSGYDDHEPMNRAYLLGSVFVPKPFDTDTRERFLAEVAAFETGLDATLRAAVNDVRMRFGLSKTEAEILARSVLRVPVKEILEQCSIKYNTYSTHKRSIVRKVNVKTLNDVCRVVMTLAFAPPSFTPRRR